MRTEMNAVVGIQYRPAYRTVVVRTGATGAATRNGQHDTALSLARACHLERRAQRVEDSIWLGLALASLFALWISFFS